MNASWDCVFLARHGQTQWNLQRRRQGQLDSPLTAKGQEQARRHAVALRPHAVDAIFSSPLPRAVATSHIIGDALALPVEIIEQLAEVHHGRFAGMTDDEIRARYPTEWALRAVDKYSWAFPGGESFADADVRAGRALSRLSMYPVRRPLLVSHDMISRMLQRRLLNLDPEEALAKGHPNDVMYRLEPATGVRSDIT